MKKIKLLAIFCFALFLASCGSDDPIEVPKSNNSTLTSFSFGSGNAGISTTMKGFISGDFAPYGRLSRPLILVTVPEGVNLTSLTPTFSIHEKAKLYINEVEWTSGKTAGDFSTMATIKVVAENETTSQYDIIVKTGIPQIDEEIYTFMSTFSIPGISISVTNDKGIMLYSSGFGFADVENKVQVTPKHLFRLASISKQFTTVCLMKLYDDGKVNLDLPVFGEGGYLADEYPGVTGAKATVTLRHFLQHNSGWTNNPIDPMFETPVMNYSLDGMIKYMLNDCTLATTPGATHYYYNLGFGVIGRVIEKISGKGFEEYLHEVTALAGVTDVHVGKDLAGRRTNECIYYSQGGYNGYNNNMNAIAAAGGIIASSDEMMKFILTLDGKGDDDILKKETIQMMYTPSPSYDRYALGWRVGGTYFPGAHWHSGNIAGTATYWCGNTNAGISAVILANSREYNIKNSIGNFQDNLEVQLRDLVAFFANK